MTDLISDYGQKIIDTSPYRIAEYKDWVEKEKIGPLVRVKWNQNTPYNNMCNDNLENFTYKDNGKYPAGCVAIAMAQILAYHHYPESAFNYIIIGM